MSDERELEQKITSNLSQPEDVERKKEGNAEDGFCTKRIWQLKQRKQLGYRVAEWPSSLRHCF